ncbi:MAG: DUF3658 domain-containing protein [Luteimonas sp.]|nr:DUF3658 domain-containing protein [Luteimonas sp.]
MDEVEFDEEGREAIARLGEDDLVRIDRAILSALDRSWKKAGFIAAGVMIAAPDEYEEIPEMFYALRIRALAQASMIEGQGDPLVLKTFEIRLPPQNAG